MRSRTLAIACFAVAALLGAPACAGPISSRIYPAPKTPLTLAGLPATAELVTVETADGLSLKGVVVPAQPGKPTLLVFHGNASAADGTVEWLAPLVARGYGIVAASYRGYSVNPGKPSEKGLAADADAFFALARTRAGTAPLWVVGHSLGGGVALGLARRQNLDALITIGTFTRMRDMAPRIARAFIDDRYENVLAVAVLDEPLFLIHGLQDGVVPWTAAKSLGEAAEKSGRSGVGYFLDGEGHRPAATALATLIDDVAARLAGLAGSPAPAGAQTFPFGKFQKR